MRPFNKIEWSLLLSAWLSVGCTVINVHQEPPQDWPELEIIYNKVDFWTLQKECGTIGPMFLLFQSLGCAWIRFDEMTCNVYYYSGLDSDSKVSVIEHEKMHCHGYDHIGSKTLYNAWEAYKKEKKVKH